MFLQHATQPPFLFTLLNTEIGAQRFTISVRCDVSSAHLKKRRVITAASTVPSTNGQTQGPTQEFATGDEKHYQLRQSLTS